jgi:hypothetical protein
LKCAGVSDDPCSRVNRPVFELEMKCLHTRPAGRDWRRS